MGTDHIVATSENKILHRKPICKPVIFQGAPKPKDSVFFSSRHSFRELDGKHRCLNLKSGELKPKNSKRNKLDKNNKMGKWDVTRERLARKSRQRK